jgi:hypothetical protein
MVLRLVSAILGVIFPTPLLAGVDDCREDRKSC